MPCERRVSFRRRKNRTQLMQHFSELNLCSALQNNLDKNEFVTPMPVRAQAIPPLMEGRDIVATAQTGTGKTLAFSIPVIEALAAVPRTKTIEPDLSPARELAIQIDAGFRQLTHGMLKNERVLSASSWHQRGRRQAREISGARETQGGLDPRRSLAKPEEQSAAGLQRRCSPCTGGHRRGGARDSCG